MEMMELGPIGTNAYLIWEDGKPDATMVDAPIDCGAWLNHLLEENDLVLRSIWLTHGHWDHIGGIGELNLDGVDVLGHADDKVMFENPAIMSAFAIPGIEFTPVSITKWLEDGEIFESWGRKVRVDHCPGHCPGNIIFTIESEKISFVGDVIFKRSVGRADLPGGDFSLLEQSIRDKVYVLDEANILYPGHGPTTTVGEECRSNPFVRP